MQAIDFALDPDDQDKGHLLIGTVSANIAPDAWAQFEGFRHANPTLEHPLDAWGRRETARLISQKDLRAHFPDDQPPFPMVSRALLVFPTLSQSPLGMLVSTRFGLMFGIRAWIEGESSSVESLARGLGWHEGVPGSPCKTCVDKPCLQTCPVGAFRQTAYDYPACQTELRRQMGDPNGLCWQAGCAARAACPQSTPYSPQQAAFHHNAVVANFVAKRDPAGCS